MVHLSSYGGKLPLEKTGFPANFVCNWWHMGSDLGAASGQQHVESVPRGFGAEET